ncbi:MAG: hypothetical protein K0R67_2380 [Paenibacillus sp.]|nr:hypothetical protein [Paenibacillus sp.]
MLFVLFGLLTGSLHVLPIHLVYLASLIVSFSVTSQVRSDGITYATVGDEANKVANSHQKTVQGLTHSPERFLTQS